MTAGCPACKMPRHPALDRARLPLHPTCEIPPGPQPPAEACDFANRDCGPDPRAYPKHGNYCAPHARMMIPAPQRAALGVPEPPRAAPAAKAAKPEPAPGLDLAMEPG